MCTGIGIFQIGKEVGVSNAGLYNDKCKDSNPPVLPTCKGGWKYSDANKTWQADETITLECIGV